MVSEQAHPAPARSSTALVLLLIITRLSLSSLVTHRLSYSRMNLLADWISTEKGITFIDVAKPTAMRPDGAMARFWPSAGARKEDCVHYCLPGVVDTISTLVYNWIIGVMPIKPPGGGPATNTTTTIGGYVKANGRVANVSNKFFSISMERWLGERGASVHLEKCGKACLPGLSVPVTRLSRQWWWAFNCSG